MIFDLCSYHVFAYITEMTHVAATLNWMKGVLNLYRMPTWNYEILYHHRPLSHINKIVCLDGNEELWLLTRSYDEVSHVTLSNNNSVVCFSIELNGTRVNKISMRKT